MTDGLVGTDSFHSGWQGYEGTDMEIVVDLLQPESCSKISTTFIQNSGSWVLYPVEVIFSTSLDGINWQAEGNIHTDPLPSRSKADREFSVTFPEKKARYIKLAAKNNGVLPEWHEYKGEPAWIFADELIVE
jgi:hexosaminidase